LDTCLFLPIFVFQQMGSLNGIIFRILLFISTIIIPIMVIGVPSLIVGVEVKESHCDPLDPSCSKSLSTCLITTWRISTLHGMTSFLMFPILILSIGYDAADGNLFMFMEFLRNMTYALIVLIGSSPCKEAVIIPSITLQVTVFIQCFFFGLSCIFYFRCVRENEIDKKKDP